MAKTTIADTGYLDTRELRGLRLYREHADAIRFDAKARVWIVPSQSEGTSAYEVRLGREESCECADYANRGGRCKHLYAATIARAKSARCSGCGEVRRRRELVEVGEEEASWGEAREGERLCRPCAKRAGVA